MKPLLVRRKQALLVADELRLGPSPRSASTAGPSSDCLDDSRTSDCLEPAREAPASEARLLRRSASGTRDGLAGGFDGDAATGAGGSEGVEVDVSRAPVEPLSFH